MLAKLAICAWTLYLGVDAKQALQVSGKALNARMVAFQKDVATNWAALRKAVHEEASNTVTTSAGVKIRMVGVEKSVLEATNAERAQFGLPALEPDPNLMQTAREHCAWMTNN